MFYRKGFCKEREEGLLPSVGTADVDSTGLGRASSETDERKVLENVMCEPGDFWTSSEQ